MLFAVQARRSLSPLVRRPRRLGGGKGGESREPKEPKDPKEPKEPRDSGTGAGSAPRPPDDTDTGPGPVAGGSYEALLKRADTAAENNCVTAIPIYQKALEQKANGVEALTGAVEPVLAGGRERLAALPERERLLERRAARLEAAHDVDQLLTGLLVGLVGLSHGSPRGWSGRT